LQKVRIFLDFNNNSIFDKSGVKLRFN